MLVAHWKAELECGLTGYVLGKELFADSLSLHATVGIWIPDSRYHEIGVIAGMNVNVPCDSLSENSAVCEYIDVNIGYCS